MHAGVLKDAGYTGAADYGTTGLLMACVGATGQGLITLDAGVLQGHSSMQSTVHQLIAGVFFLGSAMHCYALTYAIWSCPAPALGRLVTPASRYLKTFLCAISLGAAPIAEYLHPARGMVTTSVRAASTHTHKHTHTHTHSDTRAACTFAFDSNAPTPAGVPHLLCLFSSRTCSAHHHSALAFGACMLRCSTIAAPWLMCCWCGNAHARSHTPLTWL